MLKSKLAGAVYLSTSSVNLSLHVLTPSLLNAFLLKSAKRWQHAFAFYYSQKVIFDSDVHIVIVFEPRILGALYMQCSHCALLIVTQHKPGAKRTSRERKPRRQLNRKVGESTVIFL